MLGAANINANHDVALIELERPIDRSKVNVPFVNFVTPEEHKKIVSHPGSYSFIALTINLIAVSTTDYRRYAEVNGMQFNGMMNKVYGLPMLNPMYPVSTQEGDSGAPVLVNIGREWKLFAVVKGTKRDLLSSTLEKWTGHAGDITPAVNIFAPVGNKMCELLTQAGRSCL